MVNKRLVAFSLILLSVLAIALLVNAEGSSTRTNGSNDSGNNETNECTTEQDCIDSGKCSTQLECTCSNNKCYQGYVAQNDTCSKDDDCNSGYECEGNVCVLDAEDEEENETDDD